MSSTLFYQLFHRSRYGSELPRIVEDGTEEAKRQHRQREGFSAAAVAFCIEHDPAFRQRFWEQICKVEREQFPKQRIKIEVEPVHWADLRITAESSKKRAVWVIECKTGADLAPKQNPLKETAFFEQGIGYGNLFVESESVSTSLRYIILGAREDLQLEKGRTIGKRIWAQQRDWKCLCGSGKVHGVTVDLFESLGLIGVTDFRMEQAKKVQVRHNFGQAIEAIMVLEALGQSANSFEAAHWKVKAEAPDGHFTIGAYLRSTVVTNTLSKTHQKLLRILKPSKDNVAWFGYETGPQVPGGFRRSAWIYCGTKKIATELEKRFPRSLYYTDHVSGPKDRYVAITSRDRQNTPDLDWFQGVITRILN